MSVQPIPLPIPEDPPADVRITAVDAAIDYLNLPTLRPPVARKDGVHVLVADSEQFSAWVFALGGTPNRGPAVDGASLWSLRTETPQRADGSTVRILVHVALVHEESVPVEFRAAVSA
ncbi:hypothetical protein [Streptomyces sp. NPDC005548]|uniref:hypothetical protein n=1 Tax=Streptomyces sp. NPDC005548 TaxID=3364724 RepID=UPI0036CFF9DF